MATKIVQVIEDPNNPEELLLDLGTELCEELGIELADGLGDKIQSSSKLIKDSDEFYNRK